MVSSAGHLLRAAPDPSWLGQGQRLRAGRSSLETFPQMLTRTCGLCWVGSLAAHPALLSPCTQPSKHTDLASDDELKEIWGILHGPSPFSPLVKSLVMASEREPEGVLEWRSREDTMRRIEHRIRFLAADSVATLRGRFPSYREILLMVHRRLDLSCPRTLATQARAHETAPWPLVRERVNVNAPRESRTSRPRSSFTSWPRKSRRVGLPRAWRRS